MSRILHLPNVLSLIILAFIFILAESPVLACQSGQASSLPSRLLSDTTKYNGYRLELVDFQTMKISDDWVKIRFTAINSGRHKIDFGKTSTTYWIQLNFDQSLYDQKLGGLRENIRQQLIKEGFTLDIGKIREKVDLKVPTVITRTSEPEIISFIENIAGREAGALTAKGPGTEPLPVKKAPVRIESECHDLLFSNLSIVQQDDKWATIAYSVTNQGNGNFSLNQEQHDNGNGLVIRAYISGVEVLSRGALPAGWEFIKGQANNAKELKPGESISGEVRFDIRKKTRYMKCLILSLDSNQFANECDKTNNTGAVILD